MQVVGLTGRSGSGKSSVCIAARDLGIAVMDCDQVYHEITSRPSPMLSAIGRTFGKETIAGGTLNRPVLREIVFGNSDALKLLNSLTARYMGKEIRKQSRAASKKSKMLLLDAPTLFETGTNAYCDFVIGVIASEEDCISRIMERDGISKDDVEHRLSNQLPVSFFIEHCDRILENRSSMDMLYEDAKALLADLLNHS